MTALRLMGRHPAAADEIAQILQDGTETATVRLQGAAALRALAPERFAAAAKEIVLDPDDDPEVRAGCLDRLRLADHGAAVRGDPEFLRRLRTVADEATDSGVASLAQEILDDAPPAPGS